MGTTANVVVLPQNTSKLRIEEVNLPDPGPTQVVVKQFASGICHSQLHQMHRPRESPVILGHESTGVVLKVGSGVSHVKEGDTVLVTWVPRNAEAEKEPPVTAQLQVSDGVAISENVTCQAHRPPPTAWDECRSEHAPPAEPSPGPT